MLQERLNKDILIFDGASGSLLQSLGLPPGSQPEVVGIENPELLIQVHQSYLQAGSDFISLNTFGANPLKFKHEKYSYQDVIYASLKCAQEAQKQHHKESYIAYDLGPVGKLMEPMGTLTFDQVYQSTFDQINLVKDDIDVVLIETMLDIYEVKAAVLAIKENFNLPIFVTMTFEENQRTLSGVDPLTMVNVLEGLHVDALGINCSLGPQEITPIVNQLLEYSHLPIMIQPNAGLPELIDGQTQYLLSPQDFVKYTLNHIHSGVAIVGGCCGTTPEYISLLASSIDRHVVKREVKSYTRVSSGVQTVEFKGQVVVCGERLNPTGKKKLKAALQAQNFDEVVIEAIKQEQAGADVLDLNVGVPGIDEVDTMLKAMRAVQEVISLPLQIDSSNSQVIEQAVRYYNGKPLINSVNGKAKTMKEIFPIVAKYGGVVIGLTLDEDGIPSSASKRFEIAKKIIHEASLYGIKKEDIIIDCLVLTASSNQKEVLETIKAVKMVSDLGVQCVLGVSNISFGLPQRPLLNKTFLTMAMLSGLTLPIINPLDKELMATIDAFHVLTNIDQDSSRYIEKHSQKEVVKIEANHHFSLQEIVSLGLKEEAKKATLELLDKQDGLSIVNSILIPTLNQIGQDYENNKIFLPQLIQAAETAKISFEIIQGTIKGQQSTKGPVMIATVEGDIHDIGKNIVKVVMQSYGYQVIDLGRDVAIDQVVESYHRYHPKAIGLSALMTTTVTSMEKTIAKLKKIEGMCPIFVGGAVLSESYAKDIHADYYAKDAMASVEILSHII